MCCCCAPVTPVPSTNSFGGLSVIGGPGVLTVCWGNTSSWYFILVFADRPHALHAPGLICRHAGTVGPLQKRVQREFRRLVFAPHLLSLNLASEHYSLSLAGPLIMALLQR
mmetsp:Transcript_25572/g.46189  ORF Transcript_25572/g.46189 Transcript_25572/m.46189 type:complete len:111 (+) Transcript_25572:57-389(+)